MISERMFRLKKNGEPNSECYCRHPELIENYDKAMENARLLVAFTGSLFSLARQCYRRYMNIKNPAKYTAKLMMK